MFRRKGFTLIELLVVIAIIAILAAILFPVFARAREKARQTSCLSNIKELGLAVHMYVQDYDEMYPTAWWVSNDGMGYIWADCLDPYTQNLQIFTCPSDPAHGARRYGRPNSRGFDNIDRGNLGYAWNSNYYGSTPANATSPRRCAAADVKRPAETIVMMDWYGVFESASSASINSYFTSSPPRKDVYRHNEQCNVAFCDGHAKSLSQGSICQTHHRADGVDIYHLFTIEED